MKEYRILIYNGGGALIYDEIVKSKDENKAIIDLLESVTIYSDDTIKIEEV